MTETRENDDNAVHEDEVSSVIDELSEWLKAVILAEGYVDAGFVLVVRDGKIVRKRRVHESVE